MRQARGKYGVRHSSQRSAASEWDSSACRSRPARQVDDAVLPVCVPQLGDQARERANQAADVSLGDPLLA
jgi:hypothetical protein